MVDMADKADNAHVADAADVAETTRTAGRELRRIAIVNRGEAAMRLLNAVAEQVAETGRDIQTIALYTDPDAGSWFVRGADEAYCLGPATFLDPADGKRKSTYVDHDVLAKALIDTNADAVWVGWGFVAEDADFAERCEQLGVTFIGPRSDVIRALGDKIRAKRLAQKAGVDVLPWSGGPAADVDAALAAAEALGYPVLLKAASGGGGRGIRMVATADELPGAFQSAAAEAGAAFGNPTLFLEAPITEARHVEVQIIADHHGAAWALGVRDCSVQRRNQKVMEESASTALSAEAERELRGAAVRLVLDAGYTGAGTVEFLHDPQTGRSMFMEVNTRLQVEHPVTELVTGCDIVKLQLLVAGGGRLEGDPPPAHGHAIEVRLNAEDPEREFAPTPGTVSAFRIAAGPGIRVDTGITEGDEIASAFDSMVAKVLAWGSDRDEALARLDRSLARSTVVVDGGATNKGFLLGLLRHPDVRSGAVTTRWLDRLAEQGAHLPEPTPVALLAAAVVAYRREQAIVEANFHATAARGRPELREQGGYRVDLRYAGNPYRLSVHRLGPRTFEIHHGTERCEVEVQRSADYEERLQVGGRSYRIVPVDQGTTLRIEIDGIAHRVERDDGGAVRVSSPAVVISVMVAVGEEVAPGDGIAVVESMKMETTVRAPMAGRVRDVAVTANTQVEAGAVLVQLEPTGDDGDQRTGAVVSIADATVVGGKAVPTDRVAAVFTPLRAHLLGYDRPPESVEAVLSDLRDLHHDLPLDHPGLLERQQEVLQIFLDLCGLSRRRPDREPDGEVVRAPQEYLLTFLRTLDRGTAQLPASFLSRLERAMARYGVTSLERSPALEEALVWLYRSFIGLDRLLPAVEAILERWLAAPAVVAATGADTRRFLIGLVTAAQGRYPTIADLARQVEFGAFEQPALEASRRQTASVMWQLLEDLAEDPDRSDALEHMDRLVECPQPLRLMLARAYERSTDPQFRSKVLEIRLRRYYRIRDLQQVTSIGGRCGPLATADYDQPYGRIHVVVAYADAGQGDPDLTEVIARMRTHTAGVAESRLVVLDITLRWPDLPADADAAAETLRRALMAQPVGRPVHRVDISCWRPDSGPGDALHTTFRETADGWEEERLYRNLHPMLGKRLLLWRLANFDLTRLESVEDVYLFHAVARDNPDDERLFALAEVRDLTPVIDERSNVIALPHFERMLSESLTAIRRFQTQRSAATRLLWNRVILYVRPIWEHGPEPLQALAQRLAPATVGLGMQKVVVRVRLRDRSSGEVIDAGIHVENPGSKGVIMRVEPPRTTPIASLSAYRQKVLRTQRRGSVYPYEIIKVLTPPADSASDFPAGSFVEYDLDAQGRLETVERPYGQNTAGVVIGRMTNTTSKHPEGMARWLIAGDPLRSLGSLAEPECRRILAVLDRAHEEGLPVEWFALSSGARIAMDSGTENMDWIGAVLRRIVEFTESGGEINVIVTGINVGAQPYWNAEATMLMHCRGILVMTPDSAMVLTGKQALDFSGGVSAEDNLGIGGYERVMGPNGQAQYWAPDIAGACEVLLRHYEHAYVAPGERFPRRFVSSDPVERDISDQPHASVEGSEFTEVGQVFSLEDNPERKKPFDIRSVMRSVTDLDSEPLERWSRMHNAENAVVWDAHLGGIAATLLGIESHVLPRQGFHPADGPASWTAGTLFPQSSKKIARAINAASGSRPVVVLANLSGFDGSPESMRMLQLEFGAEIGRAVVNFDGPMVFVVISRYHGGAFVVFSATLNDHLEVAAIEGSRASVIGGAPAAAVVFARDVRTRVEAAPEVAQLREQAERASGDEVQRVRADLEDARGQVRSRKLGEVAEEFDRVHSIERAQQVGSVHRIIPSASLRPYLVDALERGIGSVESLSVD